MKLAIQLGPVGGVGRARVGGLPHGHIAEALLDLLSVSGEALIVEKQGFDDRTIIPPWLQPFISR